MNKRSVEKEKRLKGSSLSEVLPVILRLAVFRDAATDDGLALNHGKPMTKPLQFIFLYRYLF